MRRRHICKYVEKQNREIPPRRDSKVFQVAVGGYCIIWVKGAGKGNVAAEGIKILCEQMQELKETEGIAGIHLMAIEWEHRVAEIMETAGFLPRPKP